MNDEVKLARMQIRAAKEARTTQTIKDVLTHPMIELLVGFLAVDFARHTYRDVKLPKGTKVNGMVTGDAGIYQTPLLGDTAANWLEVGIVLAVVAQQTKDNPAAIAAQGRLIEAGGNLAAAGINSVGGVLKGLGSGAAGLIGGLSGL